MQMQNVEDVYPLSPMQQGMLFHSLFTPQSEVYFEQFSYTLLGNLDIPAFKQAWQRVIAHHPILRSLVVWQNLDTPLQVVRQQVDLPWRELDWRHLTDIEQQQHIQAELQADRAQGFEFARAPLMRVCLLRLQDRLTHFTWSFHHLLLDGWSATTVLGQVFASYEASQQGRVFRLPASRPYRDYIAWLQLQDIGQAERFWRHTLRGFTSPTSLAANPASQGESEIAPDYREEKFRIPMALMDALQAVARREQLTLNALIQGAWALLLSRYCGETDVAFGVTVSGRPASLSGVEAMIGMFINTLPLRVQVEPKQRLLPWLKQLQAQQAEARQYEHSPLVQVQAWSEAPRGQPLFESLLVFENYPIDHSAVQQSSLEIRNIGVVERTNYPLTIEVAPQSNMPVRMSYMGSHFAASTIQRLAEHFQLILKSIVSHSECELANLPRITERERQQVLVDWNATRQREFPTDVCLPALFEQQAQRSPDAIALIYAGEQLSYAQLDARANQLAHFLQRLGVGPESTVALCLQRSLALVIAVLGVLKAGGAYVPLDPSAPSQRLAFQLQDAQVMVALTDSASSARLPAQDTMIVELEYAWSEIAQESTLPLISALRPDHLAYIIYTSGSTGVPKGVMISHRGLLNYLCWAMQAYRVGQGHGSLLHSSLSFDLSVTALFTPLLVGQPVRLLPEEQNLEALVYALLQSRGLSLVKLTPAHLDVLAQQLQREQVASCANVLILGGEALRYEQLAFWRQHAPLTRLINEYGPTETVVGCCVYEVTSADAQVEAGAVPIGRPIANTQLYVLDQQLNPLPIGAIGELYIGGVGVARGYLNRPELTAERFVPHPFNQEAGARLYLSGDRARYRPDGTLEYLGRKDTQVKLRGYRIELGEIEAALSQHPGVRAAAVALREDVVGDQRLVAYIVKAQQQVEPSIGELRHYLQQRLPAYMLPSHFALLESLPLTPSGKLDRRALPLPDPPSEREQVYEAPRTPVEAKLASIWAQVLRQERIGLHDNFFELGGHSLLATQIIVRIRQAFQVDLPLRSLFRARTVAGLAEQIELAAQANQATRVPSIKRLPRPLK